jgi:predicted DNA-binding transcriptional regulator AlpA
MGDIIKFDELPDSAFVRMPTVRALCGNASRQTVERWIRDEKFPRGSTMSGCGFRVWQVGELREFLAKTAASPAPKIVRSPNGAKGGRQVEAA